MEVKMRQFLIQLDRPGKKVDLSFIQKLLKDTGVELDKQYGPICVNPSLGRYVVRGIATPEARAKAEEIPGVRFFADARIAPTLVEKKNSKGGR